MNAKLKPHIYHFKHPHIMRPETVLGVYFARKHKILIMQDTTNKCLVWNPGGSVWSGMGGTNHVLSQLEFWIWVKENRSRNVLEGRGEKVPGDPEGGRLSKGRVVALLEPISNYFGVDLGSEDILTDSTLIIE